MAREHSITITAGRESHSRYMRIAKLVLLLLAGVCNSPTMAAMTLTSADLKPGAEISLAQIYPRCGGDNISPQLSWGGAPSGTRSFVLTVIDTSVQPAQWSHWVVVDIPADVTSLTRGIKTLPGSASQIASNFGDTHYDGPCPPSGSGLHRYELTIWALAVPSFSVAPDMRAKELKAALAAAALARATLAGSVTR
jgi:Raf kinase inhibitor-like YbhB/YbcL family protein